jgi:ElaB/YqjD/DUF883 family membrane-anchored ribosome-binding protein
LDFFKWVTIMREKAANRLEPHWASIESRTTAPQVEPVTWKERAGSLEHGVQNFLSEHPKLTVAAAAAVGLVLGWMVKRR